MMMMGGMGKREKEGRRKGVGGEIAPLRKDGSWTYRQKIRGARMKFLRYNFEPGLYYTFKSVSPNTMSSY